MRHVFGFFLEEIEDSKKAFRKYLTFRLEFFFFIKIVLFYATTVILIFPGPRDEARGQKFEKIELEIKWD